MAADSQSELTQAEAARILPDRSRDTPAQERERAECERIARVHAIRGKYAHVPTSSDVFVQKKREEIAREDRRS